jgi:hypothetical protein
MGHIVHAFPLSTPHQPGGKERETNHQIWIPNPIRSEFRPISKMLSTTILEGVTPLISLGQFCNQGVLDFCTE